MSRKIDQQDIEKWNSRLSKINLELYLNHRGVVSECISIFKIVKDRYPDCQWIGYQGYKGLDKILLETISTINYQFSFSVSDKTLTRFNNILDTFLEDGMYVRLITNNTKYSIKLRFRL